MKKKEERKTKPFPMFSKHIDDDAGPWWSRLVAAGKRRGQSYLWQLPESNKIKGRCCKYRKTPYEYFFILLFLKHFNNNVFIFITGRRPV